MLALVQRLGGVSQHEAGPVLAGVIQNIDEVPDHEGLATGERKLLHPHVDGFVDKRLHIAELHARDPAIAGVRTFQAKRTRQIAGGAGVDPELFELACIDVTPGVAVASVSPAITGTGFQNLHDFNLFSRHPSSYSVRVALFKFHTDQP